MRHISLLFIICLLRFQLIAQNGGERSEIIILDTNLVKSDTILRLPKVAPVSKFKKFISKDRSFVISPELGRKPETGLLWGIYYMQLFRLSHKNDSTSRTSNVESYFDYTARKQILVSIKNNIFFNKEKFILKGENAYIKFPSLYWGIGNNAPLNPQELISYKMFTITQKLLCKISKKYFAGIQYHYMDVNNVEYFDGNVFAKENIPGSAGSINSGAGLVFLYDSRDNIINAYKGFYFEASMLSNPKLLGGKYQYDNVTLDVRKYLPLSKKKVRILALQGLLNYNSGNVPFRQLAAIGGDQIMRGYYTGRFRDKILIAAQAEFRFLVWRNVGLTTFVSLGEVGATFSDFSLDDTHYTVGSCLRVMINKKERMNIGADMGVGYQTNGLYLNFGEAF
jgi:outer membrane protein assembly factor BamA